MLKPTFTPYSIMNESVIAKARLYAITTHDAVNQSYGNTSYMRHLQMVYLLAKFFRGVLPEKHHNVVLSAAWCHDLIRDARQSFTDIRKATNLLTAEIVYAVTPLKGKIRAERYSPQYFAEVRGTLYADYIVICDRMAEIVFAQKNNDPMYKVYEYEHTYFKAMLYKEKYEPLFDYIEKVFKKDGSPILLPAAN